MLFLLHYYYPKRKRGLEGYLDAAGVSLAFLVFGVIPVVALATRDPHGNGTAYALYETVLTGYWLAFAIPVVTVGSSGQARSRGAIRCCSRRWRSRSRRSSGSSPITSR
jgi:hypothetical protein